MKSYLKPLLILVPVIAVIFYYLVSLSNRSEFPDEPKGKEPVVAAYENLDIEDLKDWKGKELAVKGSDAPIVIMHFWASWCAPCITEFPDLIKMTKMMKGQVKVFALSEDNTDTEIQAFIKSFKDAETTESFHIVWDEKHAVMNKWEVNKLPESYIFGPDRKLLKHVSGVVHWSTQDTTDYFKSIISAQKK